MNAQSGNKRSLVLFVGWAMFQAWPYAAFMSDTLLPAQAVSEPSFYGVAWPVSIALFAVFLLMTMGVSTRIDRHLFDRRPMLSSGSLLLLGTGLIAASGLTAGAFALALCVIGAAFTGIGTGFLQLCWLKLLESVSPNHLAIGVPIGYSFSLLFAFAISISPGMVDSMLLFAMIVVSLAVLACLMGGGETPYEADATADSNETSLDKFSELLPPRMVGYTFVLYMVLWFAIEVVETQAASMRFTNDPQFIFRALVGIVIALCFVGYDFLFSRSAHTSSAVKAVVLLTGGALVIVLSGSEGVQLLAYIVNYAANVLGCVFLVVTAVEYSKRVKRSTAYFAGLALAPRHIGVSACAFIHLVAPDIAVEPLNTAMLVLLLAAALFILPHALGGASEMSEEHVQAPASLSQEVSTTRDEAVNALIEEFGLTRREAEVFELFAAGRDSGYIREKLVISRDTVSSHLKHIYAKMGIHSKRELFDLIESRR